MKKIFFVLFLIIILSTTFYLGWMFGGIGEEGEILSPIKIVKPRPLDKYTIENLSKVEIVPGKLLIKEIVNEEDEYTSYLFEFTFKPEIVGNKEKTTTGQIL